MESIYASLPEPLFADRELTVAREGSREAFLREATRRQQEVAKAADVGPAEGVLLHDVCSSGLRVYTDQGAP
eukprot:3676007-Lingulodinium_polyedra.AAC.1